MHAEKIVTGTRQDALGVVVTTFHRARIDAVHVGVNSLTELRVGRLYHDHRGRAEGKKVGKAHIILIEPMEPPQQPAEAAALRPAAEKAITFESIGLTCDCGERVVIGFADIREARMCAACGMDATLTDAQIAQLEAAGKEARIEVMARYNAGETDIRVERRSKLVED